MSGKNEPTAKTSRPDDVDTFEARVERDIKQLNRKLRELAGEPKSAGKFSVSRDAPFEESFKLLKEIKKKSGGRSASFQPSGTPPVPVDQQWISATLSCLTDAIYSLDLSGSVVLMNEAAEKQCGKSLEEVRGKTVDEIVSLTNEKTLESCGDIGDKLFGEEGSRELRCILTSPGEKERTVTVRGEFLRSSDGNALGKLLVIRDITQQQQLEEELLKVRKLESVGLLAGGIAHDFNNILTGIITNLFMARMSVYKNEEACQLIADAEKAAFKATRLTKQLLTFSQGGAPVKESIPVSQLVEETVGFSLSGSNVDYQLEFEDDLKLVEVDKGQIDQVLNNLVINAAQAMPEGGTVTITAGNYTVLNDTGSDNPVLSGSGLPLADGEYVKISVRDEGPGIPRKHIGKIFDPYFTTKTGSSGLGLTTAYSIVKKHGGHIDVESKFGQGAAFSCYLPAMKIETVEEDETIPPAGEENGKVLLMDDDVIIRTVVEKLLRKTGYHVESVTNGSDAIQAYTDAFTLGEPFQFVIMDLTIPGGMGGKETVIKIKEFDKGARVIVFSGYSNDPILKNFKDYGFDGVLKKPFSTDELLHLIKTLSNKTPINQKN